MWVLVVSLKTKERQSEWDGINSEEIMQKWKGKGPAFIMGFGWNEDMERWIACDISYFFTPL